MTSNPHHIITSHPAALRHATKNAFFAETLSSSGIHDLHTIGVKSSL